jgi:hypothetical protein
MLTDKNVVNTIAAQLNSGYWEVDTKYFFNKAECLRYATKIKNYKVSYHFFDEIFHQSDWSVEPSESLDQLYAERAKQIRDKYDYLILAVSGGSDSMNMLYAFLNNGLPVDEVVSFYPVKAIEKLIHTFNYDKKSPVNVMFEYNTAFLPLMAEVSKNYPSIKITTLDHTEGVIETMGTTNAHKFDMAGLTMGPGTAGPLNIVNHQRKLNKPNSVIVTGIDKPRVVFCQKTKRFATYFHDFHSMWGGVNADIYSGFKPTVEYFYYAWEFPKLIKKQAHIIKRVMAPIIDGNGNGSEKLPFYCDLIHPQRSDFAYDVFNVQHPFFEKLIYPSTYNPNIFQADKPTSLLYAEANNWFTHSDLTDSRLKSYYDGQISEFVSGIDNHFLYRVKEGKIGGFVARSSPVNFF